MKKIVLTEHAEDAIIERELEFGWIERTVRHPEWIVADPRRAGIERRFGIIPENGGRALRVACYETDTEIRIVTVFFDRNAKKPR